MIVFITYFLQSGLYMDAGETAAAEKCVREALMIEPFNAEAHRTLAQVVIPRRPMQSSGARGSGEGGAGGLQPWMLSVGPEIGEPSIALGGTNRSPSRTRHTSGDSGGRGSGAIGSGATTAAVPYALSAALDEFFLAATIETVEPIQPFNILPRVV